METPIIKNIVPVNWGAQIQKISGDLKTLALDAEKVVIRLDAGSLKNATDILQRHAKLIDGLDRAQKGLNETMRARNIQINKMSTGTSKLTQEERALIRENKLLEKQLNRSSKSFGATVAMYAKRFLFYAGITTVLYGIRRAFKNAYKSIVDFDQAIANVGAITGATKEELAKLRDIAITLGATTKFTATEIADLETELAKLGFTTPQIIAATKGITMAAAASGEALGKTAEIVGSVTMAFGMNASETQRVADVMSKSFNSSALNLGNFSEAIKHVAPIARQTGASLEEVAAMLSVLANAGIKGSIAGTALRNIFTELAGGSGTLTEKIEALAKVGLTVEQAAGMVGKRAQASILILKDSTDEIKNLTQKYVESFGEAATVAAKQLDTVRGQFTLTKSAWNSLVLSVENGTGRLSMFLKSFAQDMANTYNGLRLSFMTDEERELDRINNIARARLDDFEKTVQQQKDKKKYLEEEITTEQHRYQKTVQRLMQIRAETAAVRGFSRDSNKRRKDLREEEEAQTLVSKETLAYIQLLKDKQKNMEDEALLLKTNQDIAEENTRQAAAFAKESYEAERFYSEKRVELEKELIRLQDTMNKTTVDGVLNSYDEREEAAREYYRVLSSLMDIERKKEEKVAEEAKKKSLSQIDNQITELKKKRAKGATPAGGEMGADIVSEKEYNITMAALSKARATIIENEAKKKQEIQDNYDIETLQNAKSLSQSLLSIESDRYSDEVYRLKVSNDEKLQLIKEFAEKQRIAAEKMTPVDIMASAFGVDRDDDFQNLRLDHEENTARLNEQMAFVSEKLAIARQAGEDEKELMRELAEVERSIEDEKREYMLNSLKIISEKTKEAYKEMAQSIKDSVSGIIEAYNDTQQKRTDEESERLDKERDERLSRLDEEALTEEAITKEKERINDEYDKKQAQLEEEQERRERNAFLLEQGLALAGIWVKYGQTMAAYTLAEAELAAALAAILGPAAPAAAVAAYAPLKTAAAVTAGANSALIAAQTIPAFAEGGMMEQTGTALVGDASLWGKPKKHEVLLYPTGQVGLTPDSPTLMNLPKGTRVYPDADKLPTLRDIERKIIVNSIFNSKEIVDELRTLVAITDKKPRLIDQAKLRRQYRQ